MSFSLMTYEMGPSIETFLVKLLSLTLCCIISYSAVKKYVEHDSHKALTNANRGARRVIIALTMSLSIGLIASITSAFLFELYFLIFRPGACTYFSGFRPLELLIPISASFSVLIIKSQLFNIRPLRSFAFLSFWILCCSSFYSAGQILGTEEYYSNPCRNPISPIYFTHRKVDYQPLLSTLPIVPGSYSFSTAYVSTIQQAYAVYGKPSAEGNDPVILAKVLGMKRESVDPNSFMAVRYYYLVYRFKDASYAIMLFDNCTGKIARSQYGTTEHR